MSVFEPNSRNLREILIFCFHLMKTVAEAHQHFRSYGEVKKCIDSWIAPKDASYFRDGIRHLPERWKKVVTVTSNGEYFES